ncbi:MAG: pyridoxal-phosphate dependent enzyme [Gemmataceae bacterium]|nr:pyridoxal-phosphate dependent enzyme [Gemmataceae bacterium]
MTHLSNQQLASATERLARKMLGHWPTPLTELPRLSEELGIRVLMKRDDCSGFYFGGNKTRHNEFLIGDAISSGCDCVVWGAEIQSNNCRQTAAACSRFGLDCYLYLSPGHHRLDVNGNLLLHYLAGARVEIVDARIGPELDELLVEKGRALQAAGRRPYFWDRSRVIPRAAVSYALCLAETLEQCEAKTARPSAVYVSSAGSTGAGLALGKAALGFEGSIRNVCPMAWPWDVREDLARSATIAARAIGLPIEVRPGDIEADESQVGVYGRPTAAGQEAMKLLMRTEAILLDPVYSAKAMAGLLADARNGKIPSGSTVVFVHTGGTPVVFSLAPEMLASFTGSGT